MTDIVLGECPDTFLPIEVDHAHTRNTTYVVGSPDQGKSTFLGNLAEQFHQAGEGVLVLDIKGDLAKDIARRTKRPEDTIYVKMGEINFGHGNKRYWTINPFEGHRESYTRQIQVGRSVVQSFERMGLAQLDTMANIRHTLLIATEMALTLEEPTYMDLYCIIVDEPLRARIIEKTPDLDPMTKREWLDLKVATKTGMSGREQRQIVGTARRRLYTLLSGWEARLPASRYKSSIKIQQWLDEGRMVLIDLGLPLQHEIGVDLGNMIMAQVLTEIYQRPEGKRDRTWRIVVDEFTQFVGESFATIMTDLRYLNAFLVIAHQDAGQLDRLGLSKLSSAVGHAHVGLLVRFSQSLQDRASLARIYEPEELQSLYDLKQFHARMTYYSRLEGNKKTETVVLNPWWCDPVEGQLEALCKRAKGKTQHRNRLMDDFASRYTPLLDADANRDSVEVHDNNQEKSQVWGKQNKTTQAGGTAADQPTDTPRPGRRGQTRALDQPAVAQSLLPEPPQD